MNLFEARLLVARLMVKEDHKAAIELGSELATFPLIRPHLECWQVTVEGAGSLSEDELKTLLKGDDINAVVNSVSMLADRIRQDIEAFGWNIKDKTVHASGWRLGITCNDEKADKLCDFLHKNFSTEIAAKAIKVKKNFSGFIFKDISSKEKALDFLSKCAN